jgi:hypothetical protein
VAESSRQTAAADRIALIRTVRHLGRQVGRIRNWNRLVNLLAE